MHQHNNKEEPSVWRVFGIFSGGNRRKKGKCATLSSGKQDSFWGSDSSGKEPPLASATFARPAPGHQIRVSGSGCPTPHPPSPPQIFSAHAGAGWNINEPLCAVYCAAGKRVSGLEVAPTICWVMYGEDTRGLRVRICSVCVCVCVSSGLTSARLKRRTQTSPSSDLRH